ncbi:MAG: fructose transport system permease protein [Subtercola sp.]|nr:fructose transport system permease protein [Subtercola sp.]
MSSASAVGSAPTQGGPGSGPIENRPSSAARSQLTALLTHQVAGPLLALVVAVIVFSVVTNTFLTAPNVSLMLQQSVVVGTLAIGQTLVILTSGIDLANGAIMVLGTVVIAKFATDGNVVLALLAGVLVCVAVGSVSGIIVARWKLPPFIVTLGMLTILAAAARLFTNSQTYPVQSGLLTWLGTGPTLGRFTITFGMILWLLLTVGVGYALTRTAWGVHVYAVGDAPAAAKLNGIKVGRVIFSVYVAAAVIYALAAWQSMGRTPIADPSAFQTANLDSITAVVIGGTSLFGGRGGVVGTLIGTLIVIVLQNGLTQAGIDSLYQQIATGALVIVAVLVDQLIRRKERT